jgi:hypothetical protein
MIKELHPVRLTRISTRIVLGRPVAIPCLAAEMRVIDHVIFESRFG